MLKLVAPLEILNFRIASESTSFLLGKVEYFVLLQEPSFLKSLWSICLSQTPAAPLALLSDFLLLPTAAGLYTLVLGNGNLHWQIPLESALPSGVTGAGNRALLAASSTDSCGTQGALVALDHAGQVRWRWEPGLRQVSAAAVQGRCIYVTALGNDASMFASLALADGREQHRSALPHAPSRNAPTVAGDLVLIPCVGPQLQAFELVGDLRWQIELPGEAWLDQSPCVASETVITVSSAGAVLALRLTDGARLWQREVGPPGRPLSAPATDGERVYVGARDGLHALRLRDGDPVWHFATERRIEAAPVLADDTLYVVGHDHHLYALDAVTGEERWHTVVKRRIETSPLLAECAGQPCIIVADEGGAVTALALPRPTTAPGQVIHNYFGPVYQATVLDGGAVAQGPGSTALGAGAVQVGGNVGGDVVTGNKIETGGGAYIGGSVNTGGGDFTGRDRVQSAAQSHREPPLAPVVDLPTLRARLQRLDAVDIESLCLDHFPAVYDKFARGLQRPEMINLLLDHCRRNPEAAARLVQLLP